MLGYVARLSQPVGKQHGRTTSQHKLNLAWWSPFSRRRTPCSRRSYPAVLRRHKEGPLAVERARYLTDLARPTDHTLDESFVLSARPSLQQWPIPTGALTKARWKRWLPDADGPNSSNRRQHAKEHFRSVATDFLRSLGRLRPRPTPLPDQYDAMLSEFIALQQEGKWLSELTRRAARCHGFS